MSAIAFAYPTFVCPRCRGPLSSTSDAYACAPCAATYPVILGIPDFRVEPDPWISLEDDRTKAIRLHEAATALDFAGSVDAYWSMTPGTPPAQARRFTAHVLEGAQRAAEFLDALAKDDARNGGPSASTGSLATTAPWLEIGCASGDVLAEAADRALPVVGVDVALRWLVIARHRPALASGAQLLVCANGEHLPFAHGVFARVVSLGTLEHCQRADDVLSESARVLRDGGTVTMRTTNRYSLLAEPHVHVWGVGFVPRRWADAYVRWRSGQRYLHHRPLSRRELHAASRRAGLQHVRVGAAQLLPSDHRRLGRLATVLAPLYTLARATPVISPLLGWIAPLLDLSARTP